MSNPVKLDTFNCRAVTDVVDLCTFSWEVKHFRQLLRDEKIKKGLKSPSFTSGSKNADNLEWQLKIQWNRNKKWFKPNTTRYLTVFLHLVDGVNSLKFMVQFNIPHASKLWDWESGKSAILNKEVKFIPGEGWGFPKFIKIEDLLDPKQGLLEDDTLKLRCRIKVRKNNVYETGVPKSPTEGKMITQKNNLKSDFSNLFNSPNFTDVSIQTKTSMLKAHKAVLSCRSPVFSAMFHSGMSEAINNQVDITDFENEIVEEMLKYIYCGEVSLESLKKNCVDLFGIAEKYDIKGLKEEAEEIIGTTLTVENVSHSLILADMNSSPSLKSEAMKFINMNKEAVMKTEGFQKIWNYNPGLIKELYQSP